MAALAALGVGGCSLGAEEAAQPRAQSTGEVTTSPSSTDRDGPRARAHDLRPAKGLKVPPGFRAEVFATGLAQPTAMAFSPAGRLYVTENLGRLVRVSPGSSSPEVIADGFQVPLGIAFAGRDAYVSSMGRLERLRLRRGEVVRRSPIVTGLPFGLHQQGNVVVGPDNRLYLGSGSTCNVCVEEDERSAAVLTVERDGTDLRVFSSGLRNPFGLAFQPGTGRLFVSVNGRDDLPDESGPEPGETIVVAEEGRDFGWPDCWPSIRKLRLAGDCAGVTEPVAYLEEHSSANGIAFYTGTSFPAEYRGNLFVALWGQYESKEHGRRVVRLVLDRRGRARSIETFVEGLPHPLAVAVDRYGALLVADWERGTIYRIQARREP